MKKITMRLPKKKAGATIQITKGVAPPTHYCKGSHGLHEGSFKLQTMPALIKSFCRGSRGTVFSKRVPLAAGGRKKGVNTNER
jgi:hypothetical protein